MKQVFQTEDGQIFESKKEAEDHVRIPKVKAALGQLTNDEEMIAWLIENQEDIEGNFDLGSIRRVSKKDRKAMEKDFKTVLENLDNEMIPFIRDNHEQFIETFKWPAVKRLSEEEKDIKIKQEMIKLTEGQEDLADWIVSNREKLAEAFEAGKVKRQVSDKAKKALEEYRAKMRAQKES